MASKNIFEVNGKLDIYYRGRTFRSDIQNIIGKFILISVPIFEGRYVQFSKGDKVEINYYTERSIIKFSAQVLGGGDERIPVLLIETPQKITRVQRRNHVRASNIIDIQCAKITEPVDMQEIVNEKIDFFDAYTLDISAGGIKAVTKTKLNMGDKLIIIFHIGDETITLQGKVVRIDEDEYKRYICGICFEKVNARSAEKIVMYVFKILREQSQKASKEA